MIREFLCRHGFHSWELFTMSPTFCKMFPEKANIGRTCRYCPRLEYLSDDRLHWNMGIRGVLR